MDNVIKALLISLIILIVVVLVALTFREFARRHRRGQLQVELNDTVNVHGYAKLPQTEEEYEELKHCDIFNVQRQYAGTCYMAAVTLLVRRKLADMIIDEKTLEYLKELHDNPKDFFNSCAMMPFIDYYHEKKETLRRHTDPWALPLTGRELLGGGHPAIFFMLVMIYGSRGRVQILYQKVDKKVVDVNKILQVDKSPKNKLEVIEANYVNPHNPLQLLAFNKLHRFVSQNIEKFKSARPGSNFVGCILSVSFIPDRFWDQRELHALCLLACGGDYLLCNSWGEPCQTIKPTPAKTSLFNTTAFLLRAGKKYEKFEVTSMWFILDTTKAPNGTIAPGGGNNSKNANLLNPAQPKPSLSAEAYVALLQQKENINEQSQNKLLLEYEPPKGEATRGVGENKRTLL